MDDFTFYFGYGWDHIISREALDHILFLTALTAIYTTKQWKQVVILVTAFTIGHSLTLALSIYDIFRFNSNWVEFLIPLTIMITAVINVSQKQKSKSLKLNYLLAFFFGLIHGMGFANTIRFMLANDQSIGIPLLSFNLGIEAGQVLIVLIVLGIYYLLVEKAGVPVKGWILTLSIITFIISAYLAISRFPEIM